jgi:ubiquinone/menaquinone biosynthesis C-methylase UbiE
MNLKICPWWLSSLLTSRVRKLLWNPESILGDLVLEGQAVADIGCGSGFFTLAMARMVGETGRVIAADIQEKMLSRLLFHAERQRLLDRIQIHQSEPDRLGIEAKLDFALLFWVLHEVADPVRFFQEIRPTLKAGARLLLAEPKVHVKESAFAHEVDAARVANLRLVGERSIRGSRAVLFEPL